MAGGIIGGALATHSPRMAAQEPAFLAELAGGARQMGERLREARPDVLVVQSAHWLTTFSWYVTCQPVHEGQCVASEAPDLIPGLPYRRTGDPDFAVALVDAIAERGVPARRNETPHFVWDYGSLVPLLYADPEAELPVVLLGTCMAATLEECHTTGEALRAAAQAADRRVLFIASGALSHALVRGPEQWPTPERRQLDRRFIDLLVAGEVAEAKEWLPEFANSAVVEVGGRHLATLLGTLAGDAAERWRGEVFGYGPSSGSGNANVLMRPVKG
ncbi:MAG: extradiol ring-cleavage dioxygenase [SAR324 cluster bacterium]|nr:extradiol ring-cleavage dioxygenase [SAR324 cluster bacterium]